MINIYKLPNNILLVGCYHPNFAQEMYNTCRINENQMAGLFKKILKII